MKKWAIVLRYVNDVPTFYAKASSALRIQQADYEIVGFAATKQEVGRRIAEIQKAEGRQS